jgi:hypothetical protein
MDLELWKRACRGVPEENEGRPGPELPLSRPLRRLGPARACLDALGSLAELGVGVRNVSPSGDGAITYLLLLKF